MLLQFYRQTHRTFLLLALSLVVLAACLVHASAVAARPVVVAYVPNWNDLDAFSAGIDYSKLTHINIAFENPSNDAGDLSFNPGDARLVDRAKAHGVKVLVSIGGGSAAEDKKLLARYARLTGEDHRDEFAKKLAIYVTSHGFDGLDVDLEGPAITADYGPFIEVLSAALKAKGKLLTAAVARDYGGSHIPASALSRFDLVNIMAYDACGPWDPKSAGQPSSLDYAKENVNYWLGRGLDRKKAVLGVPFYGYGFGRAFRKSGYTYAAIVAAFPGAEKSDHAGETIWYNGIPLIQAKARYVREEKLAGLMIWSLDQDAGGDKSLLRTIHATLSSAAKTGDARAKTGN